MTRRRRLHGAALVASLLLSGPIGRAAAEASVTSGGDASVEASVCRESCSRRCNCRQGIDVTQYKNLVLFNFGSTLAGRLEIEYERALHRRVSIFGAWYVVAFDSVGNENLVGFGGVAGVRAFVLGGAPEGLWFSATIGGFRRNPRGEPDIVTRGLQTGLMFGWTGVWNRFVFSAGAGATYNYGRVAVLGQAVTDTEFNPSFKIGVGVAF